MNFFSRHLDFFGFSASLLCAIHCALMPVVLTLSVYAGASWLANPILEWAFIGLSMAIATWSLLRSYFTQHQNKLPLLIAGIGFVALIVSQKTFLHTPHLLMAIGGSLIAYAHYANWQLSHQTVKIQLKLTALPKNRKMVIALLMLLYLLGLKSACEHNNTPPTKAEMLQLVWQRQE